MSTHLDAEISAAVAPSGELICRDPEILEGKPFIAGTRMGVHSVIGYWQAYDGDLDRILREFPHLNREQLEAALAFYQDDENQRAEIDRILQTNRVSYEVGLARQHANGKGRGRQKLLLQGLIRRPRRRKG